MKRYLASALALALSGCTMVSEKPLVGTADAAARGFTDGHWALHGPGCEVEPGKPLPDCAIPLAIRHGRLEMDAAGLASQYGQAASAVAQGTDILLVDGDPNVMQLSADFGQTGQAA